MHWAAQRQILIALGVIVAVAAIGIGGYLGFIYQAPTCADGSMNGHEEGVDCGGACEKLCTAPNVSVVWARSVRVAPGVHHAVAMVRNPDTTARGSVPYQVSLFDAENILIARRQGTFSIGPGEIIPVFEANIETGERTPARTFAELGVGSWARTPRTAAPVRIVSWELDAPGLSLAAILENRTALPIANVTVTALVYDASGTLMAASQTHSGELAPRARADLVFTWQEPFSAEPGRVDIIPQI